MHMRGLNLGPSGAEELIARRSDEETPEFDITAMVEKRQIGGANSWSRGGSISVASSGVAESVESESGVRTPRVASRHPANGAGAKSGCHRRDRS